MEILRGEFATKQCDIGMQKLEARLLRSQVESLKENLDNSCESQGCFTEMEALLRKLMSQNATTDILNRNIKTAEDRFQTVLE